MDRPKRILLIGVNWLGDALMLTPAVRAARRAHPDAHIEILVPPRVRGVFVRNPHLNGVIVYDDRAPIPSPSFWKTVFALRRRRFDAAILFHAGRTKARLARWAGIPERWGWSGKSREALLTRTAPPPKAGAHRAQTYLDLARAFGIGEDGHRVEFVPDPDARRSLDVLLRANGVDPEGAYAAVHGGGNWELKRWPARHFRAWLERFAAQSPNVPVLFCGTADEAPIARRIVDGFTASQTAVLAGQTSLDELALLFRGARFVLSNDSGPIHLAASQNAPIVGLFGPTSPAETGPWSERPVEILWKDPGCQIPCYFRACDHRVCLERLEPETVLAACRRAEKSE